MTTELNKNIYKVYRLGEYPKPKKHFYKEYFSTRRKAKNFCRNRSYEEGLVIVHPDGIEEKYTIHLTK